MTARIARRFALGAHAKPAVQGTAVLDAGEAWRQRFSFREDPQLEPASLHALRHGPTVSPALDDGPTEPRRLVDPMGHGFGEDLRCPCGVAWSSHQLEPTPCALGIGTARTLLHQAECDQMPGEPRPKGRHAEPRLHWPQFTLDARRQYVGMLCRTGSSGMLMRPAPDEAAVTCRRCLYAAANLRQLGIEPGAFFDGRGDR